MPRGVNLNDIEKGQILAYKDSGKSGNYIAKKLNRSRCLIQNFLNNPNKYGEKKRQGRPRLLSKRQERSVHKYSSNSTLSCKEIKTISNLNVSVSTILRTINRSPNIVRSKMISTPSLKNIHKTARMNFARNNMNRDWNMVSSYTYYFSIFQIYNIFYFCD